MYLPQLPTFPFPCHGPLKSQALGLVEGVAGSLPGAGRVSPVVWDELEEVTVVGGTSAEESISLRVLGETNETGWEHRTLCEKECGNAFPKRWASTPAYSSVPFLAYPLCLNSWAGMKAHGPWWNSIDLRVPLQDKTLCLGHAPAFILLHLT